MSEYPEHDKLSEVRLLSQACGEFLDFLSSKGYILAEWSDACSPRETLVPIYPRAENLLAEFFEIDQDKLEEEKMVMLEALRNASR